MSYELDDVLHEPYVGSYAGLAGNLHAVLHASCAGMVGIYAGFYAGPVVGICWILRSREGSATSYLRFSYSHQIW